MKIFRNFDWLLLAGVMILGTASLVSLASSNIDLFWKQFYWYILALVMIFFGSRIDWRWLISQFWFRYGFYAVTLLFLVVSNFQSRTIRGVKSWIVIGGFQFEPAEFAKLALIFLLAGFFSRRHIQAWLGKNIFISFIYAAIPTILIAIHPDFGSAAVVLGIWVGFIFLSGVNYKRLALGAAIAILGAVLLWVFFLKPYQKDRVVAFVGGESDPLGINYNVIQSKIAIGSAGLLGKGFKQGTETQLKFLPEAQTDFLFAAFVEEWGLVGGVVVIAAFFLIISRIISIGLRARANDEKFVILGTALVFMAHFFINIGSNLGLMPVAGITFPFLSYGGSSLLTASALISIIEHIQLEYTT